MTDYESNENKILEILTSPEGTQQRKFIEELIQFSIVKHEEAKMPFPGITIVSTLVFSSKNADGDAIGVKAKYDERIQEWLKTKSYRDQVKFEVICLQKV